MSLEEKDLLRLVRFGKSSEKEFLTGNFLGSYDVLVFNANIAVHNRASLTKFVAERCPQKSYFIDPLTHAFQHELVHIQSKSTKKKENADVSALKKSFLKLIDQYGSHLKEIVVTEGRSLRPKDLSSAQTVSELTKKVLDFQKECFAILQKKSDTSKYMKFLKKEGKLPDVKVEPSIYIAPYFFLDESLEWLQTNIECFNVAKESIADGKSAAEIIINLEVLNSKTLSNKLVNAYKKISPDWILLWVDDFDEHKANVETLTNYVNLINDLGKIGKVICLYGGYFSVSLSKFNICKNLKGVTHGMAYGEARDVVPVGGGIPVAKYYLPDIFQRLLFRDAVKAARQKDGFTSKISFHENICSCDECLKTITDEVQKTFNLFGITKTISKEGKPSKEYPTAATTEKCLRHYLNSKTTEYRDMRFLDLTSFLSHLKGQYLLLKSHLPSDSINHCQKWHETLKAYLPK